MTPERKILSAKTNLMIQEPFFATLAVQMGMYECRDDPDVPTAATDGERLFYNPDWIDTLKLPEVTFVTCHEVMHVAHEHHIRRGKRDPKIWNWACDYVINWELKEAGLTMPKDGLLDEKYAGLSAEEVYRILESDPAARAAASAGRGFGEIIDACGPGNAAEIERIRAQVQARVRQAVNIAKAQNAGRVPANIARLIERLTEPKVDWRSELRRFIDQVQSSDYTWTAPNRRYLPHGLILPSMRNDETLSHVVIFVDTSGSIDQPTLEAFGGEIDGIFGDGFVDKITVIYADADVARVEEFERGDPLVLHAAGGGGTAFSESFKYLEREGIEASVIVYFTDLCVTDYGDEPAAPVLWAVQGDSATFQTLKDNPPFGEALSLAEAA